MEDGIRFVFEAPGALQTLAFYDQMGWSALLNKTGEQLHCAMQGSWCVLCAWEGERLVGMGRVVSDGHLNTYLCGLGVLREYRGRGIGSAIAGRLLERCRAEGLSLQLMCEEHLVPRYRKLGFAPFAVGMKAEAGAPEAE
ncbi:MAG TPA: GNAT family N-acetyltransferase [Clostridia bacterium]|nr:GNAT family N-acetyltransferase [Clostridia bacterium]